MERERKLQRRFPLFLGHTRDYDTTHPSATTPAQRLSRQRRSRWETRFASCRGSAALGRARQCSAALGRVRPRSAASAAPRARAEVLIGSRPRHGRRGWVGQRRGVPGTDVPRRTTRRRRCRRDDSRVFFLPFSPLSVSCLAPTIRSLFRSFDSLSRLLFNRLETAYLIRPSLSQTSFVVATIHLYLALRLSLPLPFSLSLARSLSHARVLNVCNVCHGCLRQS